MASLQALRRWLPGIDRRFESGLGAKMPQLTIGKIEKTAATYADPSGGSLVADCYTITVSDDQGTVGVISLFDRSKAIAAREAIAWAVAEGDLKRV
jgi:hypothetical protein